MMDNEPSSSGKECSDADPETSRIPLCKTSSGVGSPGQGRFTPTCATALRASPEDDGEETDTNSVALGLDPGASRTPLCKSKIRSSSIVSQ
jgi:hypothetical protein